MDGSSGVILLVRLVKLAMHTILVCSSQLRFHGRRADFLGCLDVRPPRYLNRSHYSNDYEYKFPFVIL